MLVSEQQPVKGEECNVTALPKNSVYLTHMVITGMTQIEGGKPHAS